MLLILAGVSMSMLLGENGLINKAQTSVEQYKETEIKEKAQIAVAEVKIQMTNEKETRTMSEYVKAAEDGVEAGDGLVYEEADEYFFIDSESNVVELINIDGNLQVGKIIGKNDQIVRKTVAYNLKGGTGTVPENKLKRSGTTVEVYFETTPTKEGYRFIGYAETENGEVKYKADGEKTFTMPTKDVTLYAVWKAEKRIVFDSNYTDYTVESGTVAVNDTNGIYPTSYPSASTGVYTVTMVNINNNLISVGSKFEIIIDGFFDNNTASRMGSIQFCLYNAETLKASISVADAWTKARNTNVSYYYLNSYIVYYRESSYMPSFNGNLKIVGDGTKVSAYTGNILINAINCSEGFSFDNIKIFFGAYGGYSSVSTGVRSIYVHELE